MTTPILTMGLSLKEPLNYVKSSTFLICWFFFWVYWQFVNNPTELTTSKWWKTSKMAVLILKLALFQVRSLSNSMYCSNILVQISSYFYQPTRESRAGQDVHTRPRQGPQLIRRTTNDFQEQNASLQIKVVPFRNLPGFWDFWDFTPNASVF